MLENRWLCLAPVFWYDRTIADSARRDLFRKELTMFRCKKCSKWISAGLVCACFLQGAKVPSSGVISWITSPSPVVVASSTASAVTQPAALNAVSGKVYDVAPARKAQTGEHDDG
jgi:hypothetical protein